VSTALVEMEPVLGPVEIVTPTPAPSPAPVRKRHRRSPKRNDSAIGPWVWSGAKIDSHKESSKLRRWWKTVPEKFKQKHEEAIAVEKKSAAQWLKENAKRLREVGDDAGRDPRIGSYAQFFDSVLKKYGETTIETDATAAADFESVEDHLGSKRTPYSLNDADASLIPSSWAAVERTRVLFEGDHEKGKGVARQKQHRGDREEAPQYIFIRWRVRWTVPGRPRQLPNGTWLHGSINDRWAHGFTYGYTPEGLEWVRRKIDNNSFPSEFGSSGTKRVESDPYWEVQEAQKLTQGNRAWTAPGFFVPSKRLTPSIGPVREWNGDTHDPAYQSWLNEGRAEESQLCRMSGTKIQR
jgi:hypothetical protein